MVEVSHVVTLFQVPCHTLVHFIHHHLQQDFDDMSQGHELGMPERIP